MNSFSLSKEHILSAKKYYSPFATFILLDDTNLVMVSMVTDIMKLIEKTSSKEHARKGKVADTSMVICAVV